MAAGCDHSFLHCCRLCAPFLCSGHSPHWHALGCQDVDLPRPTAAHPPLSHARRHAWTFPSCVEMKECMGSPSLLFVATVPLNSWLVSCRRRENDSSNNAAPDCSFLSFSLLLILHLPSTCPPLGQLPAASIPFSLRPHRSFSGHPSLLCLSPPSSPIPCFSSLPFPPLLSLPSTPFSFLHSLCSAPPLRSCLPHRYRPIRPLFPPPDLFSHAPPASCRFRILSTSILGCEYMRLSAQLLAPSSLCPREVGLWSRRISTIL